MNSQQPSPPRHWTGSPFAKLGVVSVVLGLAAALALSKPGQKNKPPAAAEQTSTVAPSSVVSATSTATPSAPTVPPTTAHSEPAHVLKNSTISLAVKVSPSGAHVELDGATLLNLPFHAELARDGLVHQFEVSATGYQTQKVAVPFDRDRQLHVMLEREGQASAETPRRKTRAERRQDERAAEAEREAAPPLTAAARAASVEPGAALVSKHRSGLRVDKANPYAD